MKLTRIIMLLLLALTATTTAQAAPPQYYVAVFGITLDATGRLSDFHLVQVRDPRSLTNKPSFLHPPQSYIDAARMHVAAQGYKPQIEDGKPVEFFTSLYYVPSQPNRADLDPVHAK